MHALAEHIKDPDVSLPAFLEPASPRDLMDDSMDDVQLQHCAGNWTRAERDPALLKTLLQKEINAGHVVALPGGRTAAEERWPQRTAVGKLNIVIAEGRPEAVQCATQTHSAASQSM